MPLELSFIPGIRGPLSEVRLPLDCQVVLWGHGQCLRLVCADRGVYGVHMHVLCKLGSKATEPWQFCGGSSGAKDSTAGFAGAGGSIPINVE